EEEEEEPQSEDARQLQLLRRPGGLALRPPPDTRGPASCWGAPRGIVSSGWRIARDGLMACIVSRFYLTAKTDRFLVGPKEGIVTPEGGLGGIQTGCPGTPPGNRRFLF
ncbi:unnamed protein product, partial [Prorocentrum cordatum]